MSERPRTHCRLDDTPSAQRARRRTGASARAPKNANPRLRAPTRSTTMPAWARAAPHLSDPSRMHIDQEIKLDFKDVLIRPKRSTLPSRAEVDISREFAFKHSHVSYHAIPIIAANMDTIGTFEMARALAPFGLSVALHKHYGEDELAAFFTSLQVKSTAFYSMGISAADLEKFARVLARCGDA